MSRSRISIWRASDHHLAADMEKRQSNREYIDRLFSLKRFLPTEDLDWIRMAEWKFIGGIQGTNGDLWLQCPVCDAVTMFHGTEVAIAYARPSIRPFLKCECDFQPYLPDEMVESSSTALLITKGDHDKELWIELDGGRSNEEDHLGVEEDGGVRRQDPRKFFPVPRAP